MIWYKVSERFCLLIVKNLSTGNTVLCDLVRLTVVILACKRTRGFKLLCNVLDALPENYPLHSHVGHPDRGSSYGDDDDDDDDDDDYRRYPWCESQQVATHVLHLAPR